MRKAFVLIGMVFLLSLCYAQSDSPAVATSSAYVYSGPSGTVDQLKIYTYIWGQVRSPGLYLVPDNTDLLTLISLAGGPTENAKMSRVRIVRQTDEGDKIIWIDLRDYVQTGNQELIPMMKPGDTVVISGSTFYAFSKVADFLSKVVIVLSVYNMVVNISK